MPVDPIRKPSGDVPLYTPRDPIGVEKYHPTIRYRSRATNATSRWLRGVADFLQREHTLAWGAEGKHETLKIPVIRLAINANGAQYFLDPFKSHIDESMPDGWEVALTSVSPAPGQRGCQIRFALGLPTIRGGWNKVYPICLSPDVHVASWNPGGLQPTAIVLVRNRRGYWLETSFTVQFYRIP